MIAIQIGMIVVEIEVIVTGIATEVEGTETVIMEVEVVFLLYFSGEHKHSFYRKVIDRGAREDRGRDRPSRWGDDRERGPPGGGDGFRGG